MSQITNTVCDGCGKVKGETNHWFKSYISETMFEVARPQDRDSSYKDYCGQNCITKAFQEWLNAQQEAHEATIQNSVDCNNGYEKLADEVLETPTKECLEITDYILMNPFTIVEVNDEDIPF